VRTVTDTVHAPVEDDLTTDLPFDRRTVPPTRVPGPTPQRLKLARAGIAKLVPVGPARIDLEPRRTVVTPRDRTPARAGTFWSSLFAPGWQLKFLLVGFPLWWVLGLSTFIFPIMAVPMAWELCRRRPLKYPPFFWMWALFLFWQVISVAMFNVSPPGTHATSAGGRITAIGINFVEMAGITVTLLYVGSLTLAEVSQRDIARWMGWFFLVVVSGGFLGVVAPHFQFRSALEYVLPAHYTKNPYISALVHPIAAQVQDVLGEASGRPSAPFGYTNSWGNTLGLLIAFFIVGWVLPSRSWRRLVAAGILGATFIPVLLSLNRGLWIGLIGTMLWFVGRQVIHGRVGVLAAVAAIVTVAGIGFVVTPAHTVVTSRLENGKSNNIRNFVAQQSLNAVKYSPVIGYGGNRHTNGSYQSIAIGKTANCNNCGDVATGSTGQFWAIMFNQGIGGLVFYLGFFAAILWRYRRERTPIAEAALATIAASFLYILFYGTVPVSPTLVMIAVGVLWRSGSARGHRPAGAVAAS
jgi:O-antigen ligase